MLYCPSAHKPALYIEAAFYEKTLVNSGPIIHLTPDRPKNVLGRT